MGKPKAPAAPDYVGAAKQQGEANLNAALATNYLNQQNQVGPYGSMTFSYSQPGQGGHYLADGTYIPTTTVETKLSPQEQALYDQTNQISQALNNTALRGLDYADQVTKTPITDAGMPGRISSVSPQRMELMGAGPKFDEGYKTSAGLQTSIPGQQLSTQYDFSGVGAMPASSDFAAQRDQITDALMQRLQPYIDRDRDRLQTRLANQGLGQGSEAYAADQDIFQRGVNDQRIAALLAGSSEQQRLFDNAMGIRGAGVAEAVAQGNFGNTAKNDMFRMGLASGEFRNNALQQELLNQQTGLDRINATRGMQFESDLTRTQANNQARESMFNQGLASGQFANQARSQAIQEQDYFRNAPINLINALRSGNQMSMPQFQNWAGGAGVEAAPMYAAVSDQYNAELQKYQQKMAGFSAMLGGLGKLGGAVGGAAISKWG